MYHVLGFLAVVLAVVFIWAVGEYNTSLGDLLENMYVFVIVFFIGGLMMLGKMLLMINKRENIKTGNGEEEKTNTYDEDFYLIGEGGVDAISYRIENAKKQAVFGAVGTIIRGSLHSLELLSHAPFIGAGMLSARETGENEYTVREGETIIGTIRIRKECWDYVGVDSDVVFHADFADEPVSEEEEAVEGIMTLVTLTPHSERAKANILLIKDAGGEVLGKYYYPLRNLEMVKDIYSAIEMRIVLALAIIADAKLQLAQK